MVPQPSARHQSRNTSKIIAARVDAQDKTSCVTNANRRNDRGGRVLGQLRETASAHMTTDPSRVGAVALRASGISTERSYEIAVCAFGRTHLR